MDWNHKNRMPGDPEHNAKLWFADLAKQDGCWIYSKTSKRWYTPSEFIFSKETVNYEKGKTNTKHLVIKHPISVLSEAADISKRAAIYLQEINEKIWKDNELKKK